MGALMSAVGHPGWEVEHLNSPTFRGYDPVSVVNLQRRWIGLSVGDRATWLSNVEVLKQCGVRFVNNNDAVRRAQTGEKETWASTRILNGTIGMATTIQQVRETMGFTVDGVFWLNSPQSLFGMGGRSLPQTPAEFLSLFTPSRNQYLSDKRTFYLAHFPTDPTLSKAVELCVDWPLKGVQGKGVPFSSLVNDYDEGQHMPYEDINPLGYITGVHV